MREEEGEAMKLGKYRVSVVPLVLMILALAALGYSISKHSLGQSLLGIAAVFAAAGFMKHPEFLGMQMRDVSAQAASTYSIGSRLLFRMAVVFSLIGIAALASGH